MSIWWDKSITLVEGCTPVSAGCDHCWSAGITSRFHADRGFTDGPHFNGKILFRADRLQEILKRKKPTKWTIWNDLFHPDVTFEQLDKAFAVFAVCPQHTFLILTKRARRMREYVGDMKTPIRIAGAASTGARMEIDLGRFWGAAGWPLLNVHCGVTVENQDNAGRIADLIQTPTAKRFLSLEPLLGRIDIPAKYRENIDYVFIGCESGPGARLCTIEDIWYLMQQCQVAGVQVHVKQIPLDGRCNKHIEQWPPEFQVREV